MLAPITMEKALDLAALNGEAIPQSARAIARLSLFDWLTVARAGAGEPVAKIVRGYVAEEGGREVASVAGLAQRLPARAAALANGATSHALDYDDTHFAHVGHPSVAVLPAALALSESQDASAGAALDAFLLGAEASVRIGIVLGRAHYNRGFHQTATAGAFGAAVAAARALGLERDEARHALSLVATRASGLKSQFGSMGKPFNAGLAAANGVEAAELARRGFISCDDGLGGPQGFIDAHVDYADEAAAWGPPIGEFLFEAVKHKLHACCHGLHATIEALKETKTRADLTPDKVERVDIRVNPRWLRVCDIKAPRTALEAKFSYAMIAAMTLYGVDTAADRSYTDALCREERLVGFWPRVAVVGDESIADTAAQVALLFRDGRRLDNAHDIAAPIAQPALAAGLRAKSRALLGADMADRLWRAVGDLDALSARDLGALLAS